MSRVADASYNTYLDSNSDYKICRCYRIVTLDGTQYGFTDHDNDLTIDLGDGLGSLVYLADTVIDTSELQNKDSIGSSNVDVNMTLLETNSFEVGEVLVGQFDDAAIDIFDARWDVTPHPVMRGFCGLLTSAEIQDNQINVTYRSFGALWDQDVLRIVRRGCHYELGLHTIGYHRCWVQLEAPDWTAATAFTARTDHDTKTEVGAICKPTTYNGFWYIATTAGTTGATEPAWPTTVNGTVTDGTVSWKAIKARRFDGTVNSTTDTQTFYDAGNAIESGWWRYGYLIWNTGANAGRRMEIESDDGAGNIRLFDRMYNSIEAGDTYTIVVGCDHLKVTCKDKFDNIYWFGGFDDAPGVLTIVQTPYVHSN